MSSQLILPLDLPSRLSLQVYEIDIRAIVQENAVRDLQVVGDRLFFDVDVEIPIPINTITVNLLVSPDDPQLEFNFNGPATINVPDRAPVESVSNDQSNE